ncbi:hypothetical protein BTO20_37810 (plasmid) [Mycobacterium dioxanotrophicus]|jgi:hypothetical protein|uniref:Uncharacterized protein n=1 Tax=Mycobacterium dioxanotrophicus TaxID=482462 RepID=A0A1Y0CGH2_9MYCO|nr:hypothetical protein [Mycobacterium dioxanotrophicus]ART74378.1 hypothetical protein BTO20_37810 [Mycobacterium dioxanotrophicus]
MTEPVSQPGWIARTFTRARVLGVHLARIPFGDKSFDLPIVLSRVQLTVLGIGVFCGIVAFAVGSKLGIAAWLTWPVAVVTLAVMVALGFSSAPDRGAGLAAEGYARMLWVRLPFVSSISSSRPRSASRNIQRTQRIRMSMQLHEPPVFTQKRSRH